MKKNLNLIIMAATLLCAACSSGGDLLDDYTETITNGNTGTSTSGRVRAAAPRPTAT
jgi:protein involved in sex pheromone biosynthesis